MSSYDRTTQPDPIEAEPHIDKMLAERGTWAQDNWQTSSPWANSHVGETRKDELDGKRIGLWIAFVCALVVLVTLGTAATVWSNA